MTAIHLVYVCRPQADFLDTGIGCGPDAHIRYGIPSALLLIYLHSGAESSEGGPESGS